MSLKYWLQPLHILYDGYIHMKIQRYFKKLFCNLNILKQNNFYHSLHTHSVYQISNILFESILRILSPKFDKYKHTGHKHVSNTCNQLIFNISSCAFHKTSPSLSVVTSVIDDRSPMLIG